MLPCLFCESASGDLPQAMIHADREVVALLDWRQSAPGHVLVLPRRHLTAEEVFACPTGAAVLAVTMRLARAIQGAFDLEAVQMGAILYPGGPRQFRASGWVAAGENRNGRAAGHAEAETASAVETAEDGHFHLHLLPRRHGGELARIYPFGDAIASLQDLEKVAERIRAALSPDAGRLRPASPYARRRAGGPADRPNGG